MAGAVMACTKSDGLKVRGILAPISAFIVLALTAQTQPFWVPDPNLHGGLSANLCHFDGGDPAFQLFAPVLMWQRLREHRCKELKCGIATIKVAKIRGQPWSEARFL